MPADRCADLWSRGLAVLAAIAALGGPDLAAAQTITEFPLPTAGSAPSGIVAGPDGALWFVEVGTNAIGRITTDGAITEFTIPFPTGTIVTQLGAIAAGADGALWFTAGYAGTPIVTSVIGRITTDGVISFFTI